MKKSEKNETLKSFNKYNVLILIVICVAFALSMSFCIIEVYFRYLIYSENKKDPDINNMLFYNAMLDKNFRNKSLSFRMYTNNAKLVEKADYYINNMQCFSKRDYSTKREKNEFRIVVLGNEQTASSVADVSWPDHLEDELNKRGFKERIKVFNLAWPDNGPMDYLETWSQKGKYYKPDLVIVNYVETDFWRALPIHTEVSGYLTYRGKRVEGKSLQYRLGPDEKDVVTTTVSFIQGHPVESLADPNSVPSRPYPIFSSVEFMDNKKKVLKLQDKIVDDVINGAMPYFGYFTINRMRDIDKPSLTIDWLKRIFKPIAFRVSIIRNFDPQDQNTNPIFDAELMINNCTKIFSALKEEIPNLLITHNFNHVEYAQKTIWNLTEKMMQRNKKIKVIDMRTRVQPNISGKEVRSWYLETMGEKWSNKGHHAYAKMIADIVLDWKNKRK